MVDPSLDSNELVDALTLSVITIDGATLESQDARGDGEAPKCRSLFFPGCALVNYAPRLLIPVYQRLRQLGIIDGMTLVCCGEVFAFEENGRQLKAAYHEKLREQVLEKGITRVITSCPSCNAVFRALLSEDLGIEVTILPEIFADLGYRIDIGEVSQLQAATDVEPGCAGSSEMPRIAIHDSCSDRSCGDFAAAVRALFVDDLIGEMKNNREHSLCCGSRMYASGKREFALKLAQHRYEQAHEAKASMIVSYCAYCSNFLSQFQEELPIHHYLELLEGVDINWKENTTYLDRVYLL